jgi:hypothetical protein
MSKIEITKERTLIVDRKNPPVEITEKEMLDRFDAGITIDSNKFVDGTIYKFWFNDRWWLIRIDGDIVKMRTVGMVERWRNRKIFSRKGN